MRGTFHQLKEKVDRVKDGRWMKVAVKVVITVAEEVRVGS